MPSRTPTIMNSHDLPATSEAISLPHIERLNTTGAAASFICAIHCALMPILVTLLPLIGLGFLASEPAEWALITMSAILGVSSLCLGYRAHRRRWPLAVLSVGLALLVLGRVSEVADWGAWGVPVLVCGGFIIVLAHLINGKLCRSCRSCHPHTCG